MTSPLEHSIFSVWSDGSTLDIEMDFFRSLDRIKQQKTEWQKVWSRHLENSETPIELDSDDGENSEASMDIEEDGAALGEEEARLAFFDKWKDYSHMDYRMRLSEWCWWTTDVLPADIKLEGPEEYGFVKVPDGEPFESPGRRHNFEVEDECQDEVRELFVEDSEDDTVLNRDYMEAFQG